MSSAPIPIANAEIHMSRNKFKQLLGIGVYLQTCTLISAFISLSLQILFIPKTFGRLFVPYYVGSSTLKARLAIIFPQIIFHQPLTGVINLLPILFCSDFTHRCTTIGQRFLITCQKLLSRQQFQMPWGLCLWVFHHCLLKIKLL